MHWIALQPPSDADALPLAWQALRYTPRVCLLDESVLLEVSGSERLWGGRARLLSLVCDQKMPLRHDRWSHAATSLVAIALLRLGLTGLDVSADVTQAINRLPLQVLSAANDALPMLNRAGCRTWGDVRALPRAGVARRFGAGLLLALDQAYGDQPESHRWLSLPEQFEQSIELQSLADSAPMLMFGAQRLLALLRAWLQARHVGVLTLELRWRYDLRRMDGVDLPLYGQLQLRTAEPTQDMAHLSRLMAENLARTPLAAPVNALILRATDTAPLATLSRSLLPSDGAVAGWNSEAYRTASLKLVRALPTLQQIKDLAGASDKKKAYTTAIDALCRFNFLGNLTGLPAGSAPVGLADDGLPVGFQLIGDAWDEAIVLGAMSHLERIGVARTQVTPSKHDLLER